MGIEDDPHAPYIQTAEASLVFSVEPALAVCQPCFECRATGRNQDSSLTYSPTATYEELACKKCSGRGYKQMYSTAQQLYSLLKPHFLHDMWMAMPELVEKLKIELIREIMEA